MYKEKRKFVCFILQQMIKMGGNMLKNKIVVRKIRNIVILLMVMIIMIGAYNKIDTSRAEDVPEIGAIALDNYGYLAKEEFKLMDDDNKTSIGLSVRPL